MVNNIHRPDKIILSHLRLDTAIIERNYHRIPFMLVCKFANSILPALLDMYGILEESRNTP